MAGKPHGAMAALMRDRYHFSDGEAGVVMVGDQPRTDGRLAERLGIPFGLVDSGVTRPGSDDSGVPVTFRAADLVSMVRACLSG